MAWSWIELAVVAPIAFFVGVGMGFILSNSFRIIRRNGGRDYSGDRRKW